MAVAKKPSNLVYGVGDTPPLPITLLNGIQHVGLIAINLVYPLLIFRVVGAPVDAVTNLMAVGMLVLGMAITGASVDEVVARAVELETWARDLATKGNA